MPITCPACGKTQQATTVCARCGSELTSLYGVARAAAGALSQAHQSLRTTDWAGALKWAESSWDLCHSVEAARLAFLATAALGHTTRAFEWRRRALGA
jgi:hypothetical protein